MGMQVGCEDDTAILRIGKLNGAFMRVGCGGKADRGGDGTISIRELTGYIGDRLPDLSEEASGEPQFPVINSKGNDFPIAVGT